VIVGRVRNVHGLRGELVIEPHTDEPDAVFAPGRRLFGGNVRGVVQPKPLEIQSARPFKQGYIVKLDAINDRNEAELWRERFLFAPYEELTPLDEGEVYLHEFVGMHVDLVDGSRLGEITAYYELPQGLLFEVSRGDKPSILIPYDRVVTAVDRSGRVVQIDPPKGLIDD
jgi:16S rRNA processing protein RimM